MVEDLVDVGTPGLRESHGRRRPDLERSIAFYQQAFDTIEELEEARLTLANLDAFTGRHTRLPPRLEARGPLPRRGARRAARRPRGARLVLREPGPALFGSFAPGETSGAYRTGGDVMVTTDDGASKISGTDFALAYVDEIEQRNYPRQRFTVGH